MNTMDKTCTHLNTLPGDEVVLYDGDFSEEELAHAREHGVELPLAGKRYTVRALVYGQSLSWCMYLNEISNPRVPNRFGFMLEPAFKTKRFRKAA